MREFEQVIKLMEEINIHHKHHLISLGEDDKLLLMIKTDDGGIFSVKVSKNGLEILKDRDFEPFKNTVEISLKDLIKLINHRSYILRYLMTGRIKVKGNVKKILDILQNL